MRILTPRRATSRGAARPLIVEESALVNWVETLSLPRHHRFQPRRNAWTADWIAENLRRWGYDVALQGRFRNVLALPRENHRGRRPLVLIAAHYDSVGLTPGADDNASGVAAMLACARAASSSHPPPALGFVAFNAEEDGLAGSKDFVTWLPQASFRVECVHVLEMVGYASSEPGSQRIPKRLPVRVPRVGDFIGVIANHRSGRELNVVLREARSAVPDLPTLGLKTYFGTDRLFPVLHRSDHSPFWRAGIPALMWTDTAEFRNPHYHEPSDTPDTLDYGFLQRVATLVFACALARAGD